VGDTIYDATRFLEIHPGGKQSILKKSGGACDCTADMHFHSRTAIKKMKAHKVGKVRKCEREAVIHATDDQCIIC
jgi:cytochrome b involved in lipid metabolism